MTREEITNLDGTIIDRKMLNEIQQSEEVKAIRDNGMDGRRIGKRWYVVVFNDGYGVSVYVSTFAR